MPNNQTPHVPGAKAPSASAYSTVVLSEQMVVEHIKHCRDLTRSFAYRVFPAFWREWCKQLLELAEQARSNADQAAFYETQNLLTAVQQAAEQEFGQHLANGFVKFKQKSLHTLTGEERFNGDILSLVDYSDLEETVAITSITHRADNVFAESLWMLQQRLALLNDGEKIEERSNPASPVQFCEALRKVLIHLEVDVKVKILGYKQFDQDVIGKLGDLYEELNDYLVRQNLLPNLRFTLARERADHERGAKNDPVAGASSAAQDADQHLLTRTPTEKDIQYQNSLLSAIRLLQHHVTSLIPHADSASASSSTQAASSFENPPVAAVPNTPSEHLRALDNQQLVSVLAQMQDEVYLRSQQLLAGQERPGEILPAQAVADVSRDMMQQIARNDENGAVNASDMHIIDLVGMLFEYMLSDEQLPDSVKALLSYLHTPFLKIAFIDKDFFEQPEHPARILLNNLAEAGVRWVSNDGSDQYDIFNQIKNTVFRLLREFKNDVRIFAELLFEFSAYTHNVARRHELMERRALEKAQGEEKLREAKLLVNAEVRRRTDQRDMPSAILLLLLQPWSDYLSFVLLRYGDKSGSWSRGLSAMDELLWSLEPKTTPEEKDKLLKMQDTLLETLGRGFDTIGYEQSKGRKLLEAVASLQRLALLSKKVEPAPAAMRHKLEALAAEKAGYSLVSQEMVSAGEVNVAESLKMVEFGTWFEFEGGKRLKVAWYNQKTRHYLLVDQQGRKVSLMAGLELAREMLAGRTTIIAGSTKPFFERALENIYQTLNDRADHLKTEVSS